MSFVQLFVCVRAVLTKNLVLLQDIDSVFKFMTLAAVFKYCSILLFKSDSPVFAFNFNFIYESDNFIVITQTYLSSRDAVAILTGLRFPTKASPALSNG